MSKPFYSVGAYIAVVTQQALGKTSNNNPQLVLGIKILGQPDPKDSNNYIEAQRQYDRAIYRVITEKTIDYVLEDLETLGFDRGYFAALDPSHPNHQSFVGNQIDVWCKHKLDQNNEPREEWSISRKMSSMQVTQLDSKELRELDSLFGKHLRKGKTAAPPHQQRPQQRPQQSEQQLQPVAAGEPPPFDDFTITDAAIPF